MDRDPTWSRCCSTSEIPPWRESSRWRFRRRSVRGRRIGICGQAPSDYPEFARFLVEPGIDRLSLNPDAVIRTTVTVLDIERMLVARKQTAGPDWTESGLQ
ncbi:MAG: hypothetical protein NNA31_02820 [Nitrospira sp.]|nr:hypothetical protein [Nitrospira sp.]